MFPSCPVLDRFMRPDSTDLGPLWDGPSLGVFYPNGLELVGQELIATGSNGNAMSVGRQAAPVDAFAVIGAQGGSGAMSLLLVKDAGSANGYGVEVFGSTLELRRWTGGTSTVLESVSATTAAGYSFGIRVADGAVEGWTRAPGGAWTRQAVAIDAAHDGPFRLAPIISDAAGVSSMTRVGFGQVQPGRVFPTVLVDWGGGDGLVIGSGTIGTDALAGFLALQPSFVHEFSDMTRYVQGLSIQRGRSDTNTPSYAGRAEVQFRDPEGGFIPGVGSGVTGLAVDVMHGVRVIATHQGDDYNLFTGFIARARQEYRPGAVRVDRVTYLSCDDASAYIGNARVGAAFGSGSVAYSSQEAHELVDLWLSQVNVPWRDVGTASDTTGLGWVGFENVDVYGGPDPSAPTALALIQDLLVADQGAFFIDAGGTAVYRRRTLRYPGTQAPVGTLTQVSGGMEPIVDLANLATRIIISSTGTAFTTTEPVTYPYSGPIDRYGYRDLSVSTQFIKDNSHFNELGEFLLQVNTAYGGTRRVALPVERDPAETALALGLELNDKVWLDVTVARPNIIEGLPGGGSKFVDGIEHTWTPGEPLRTALTLGYDHGAEIDGLS